MGCTCCRQVQPPITLRSCAMRPDIALPHLHASTKPVPAELAGPGKLAYTPLLESHSSGALPTPCLPPAPPLPHLHPQENYFFDGAGRELNSRRVVLRVRFYNGNARAVITLKVWGSIARLRLQCNFKAAATYDGVVDVRGGTMPLRFCESPGLLSLLIAF